MAYAIQIKKEIIMNSFIKKIIWIIFLAPVVYLAIIWNTIPDTVPLHFDLKGNANRYGSKNELLLIAGILTGVNILCCIFFGVNTVHI